MTMVSLILPCDQIEFFWNYLRVEDTYLTRKRRLVKNGHDQSDHRAHFWSEGIQTITRVNPVRFSARQNLSNSRLIWVKGPQTQYERSKSKRSKVKYQETGSSQIILILKKRLKISKKSKTKIKKSKIVKQRFWRKLTKSRRLSTKGNF